MTFSAILATMATRRGPKSPMTDEHKAALAQGRSEGRIVKEYLEALRSKRPKRGRKRTPASIDRRLNAIDKSLADANPLSELKLIQERRNLQRERDALAGSVDLGAVEERFVDVAKGYSQRQGISYAAWREVGVEPQVLIKAGISRSS